MYSKYRITIDSYERENGEKYFILRGFLKTNKWKDDTREIEFKSMDEAALWLIKNYK
jgi:hypothetical protein